VSFFYGEIQTISEQIGFFRYCKNDWQKQCGALRHNGSIQRAGIIRSSEKIIWKFKKILRYIYPMVLQKLLAKTVWMHYDEISFMVGCWCIVEV